MSSSCTTSMKNGLKSQRMRSTAATSSTISARTSTVLSNTQRQRTSRRRHVQIRSGGDSSDTEKIHEVVIVGGGISGLSAAVALLKQAPTLATSDIIVTESRSRVGGNITTCATPTPSPNPTRYLWEEGPNSFQPSDAVLRMIVDVGLKKELVLGDPTQPRFVLWDKMLRKVPSSPLDFLSFELISFLGSVRAGLGAIGIRPAPPSETSVDNNDVSSQKEETVKEFVVRNLGEEVFMKLVEPFCSGVYAGDPTKLSMKAAFGKIVAVEEKGGSLIGGAIQLFRERMTDPASRPPPRESDLPPKPKGQTVASFKSGLATLPDAMEKFLGPDVVKTGWTLEQLAKDDDGYYLLDYSIIPENSDNSPVVRKQLKSKVVVMSTPAYVTAELLRSRAPDVFDLLSTFYYPPVAAVTLSYPIDAVKEERLADVMEGGEKKLPGFGQLHPRTQGVTTLGTIYSSSLFPNRAPDGEVLLLNYIGGATNTVIGEKSKEDVVKTIDNDLRMMLIKNDAPEPRLVGFRVWPRAIPQFTVGHFASLDGAREALKDNGLDGIVLAGNYVHGVALGKCIEGGYATAKEVSDKLAEMKVAPKSESGRESESESAAASAEMDEELFV